MTARTHIPDHGTGRTYCGRWVQDTRIGRVGALCIDLTRQCIEAATCRTCQRADDRRVREAHERERLEALFAAAVRWAERRRAEWLWWDAKAKAAVVPTLDDDGWVIGVARALSDLESDAREAGAL